MSISCESGISSILSTHNAETQQGIDTKQDITSLCNVDVGSDFPFTVFECRRENTMNFHDVGGYETKAISVGRSDRCLKRPYMNRYLE